MPTTRTAEQVSQLGQVGVSDFLGRDRFFQQSTRRLQEHAGKERFILGKDAVQDAQNLAFAVPDLPGEPETKAAEFWQLQDDGQMLSELAEERGVSAETLLNLWVQEKLWKGASPETT